MSKNLRMTFLHLLERDVKKIFYDILMQNNGDLGKGPNENDKLGGNVLQANVRETSVKSKK